MKIFQAPVTEKTSFSQYFCVKKNLTYTFIKINFNFDDTAKMLVQTNLRRLRLKVISMNSFREVWDINPKFSHWTHNVNPGSTGSHWNWQKNEHTLQKTFENIPNSMKRIKKKSPLCFNISFEGCNCAKRLISLKEGVKLLSLKESFYYLEPFIDSRKPYMRLPWCFFFGLSQVLEYVLRIFPEILPKCLWVFLI